MQSIVKISSCQFINGTSSDIGAAVSSIYSEINIDESVFENLISAEGSLIFANS